MPSFEKVYIKNIFLTILNGYRMPRKYVRKHTVVRGQWTEENLILAMEKVKNGEISKNEAQRLYGIPIRTLSRRLKTGDTKKAGLGPQGIY